MDAIDRSESNPLVYFLSQNCIWNDKICLVKPRKKDTKGYPKSNPGKYIYREEVTIPLVQLSTNYGLGCLLIAKK